MSLREMRDARALMLRLVLAELLAKRGEGPLARRAWRPVRTRAWSNETPNASAASPARPAERGKGE